MRSLRDTVGIQRLTTRRSTEVKFQKKSSFKIPDIHFDFAGHHWHHIHIFMWKLHFVHCILLVLNLLCLTQILLSNIVNFKPVYVRCDVVCNERIQTPDWNLAWISNNTLHTHLKVGNFLENRFSRTPHIWCYRTKMF